MPKTLGSALRLAREQAGMTQSDLARRAQIAPSHLVRLENGEKQQPRFETIVRLAVALGLSLDELATDCGMRKGTALRAADAAQALRLANKIRRLAKELDSVSAEAIVASVALESHAGVDSAALNPKMRAR